MVDIIFTGRNLWKSYKILRHGKLYVFHSFANIFFMKIADETIEIIEKQFALDCNLEKAEEIQPGKVFLSKSELLPGARIVHKTDIFFRAVLFMGKAYLMADESIYDGCAELFRDVSPDWFCKFPNLRILDRALQEFGHEIADTHIYYLPDWDAARIEEDEPVIWLSQEAIQDMKEENPFPNAFCYSPTQPDIIGVGVVDDSGGFKGMAGASLDGKYVRQIGVDIREEYRGHGLAVYLTTLIKQRLSEQGTLPFYGTSESHSLSRSVAVKSGFLPAWCEIYVKKQGG